MASQRSSRSAVPLTTGSPIRVIISFALPMLLSTAFQQLYTSVDTLVMGRYVSVESMAAIGATASMVSFFLFSSIGLCNGLNIVMAQFVGAKNEEKVRETAAASVFLTLTLSLVMGGLGLLLSGPILRLLETPIDILDISRSYVRVIFSGMLLTLAYNMASAMLRALGDSRAPLLFLIAASFINVGLDLLFVLVFSLGARGVALATITAQGIAALLSVFYIRRHYPKLKVTLREIFRPSFSIIGRIIKIGGPMGLQSLCFTAGMMVIQRVINSFGTSVVAGYTAGVRVEEICWMTFTTIGHAMSSYAGQNAGAKDLSRIQGGHRAALLLISVCTAFSMLLVYTAGPALLRILVTDQAEEVISVGRGFLFVNAAFFFPMAMIMLYAGILRGIGEIRIPLFSAFLELFSKVFFSVFLSQSFGYFGIWFAEPIGWILGAVPLIICYFSGRWKQKVQSLDV